MTDTTKPIPYGPNLGKITEVEHDGFDGHQSYGQTDDPALPGYRFRTNFNKELIDQHLEIFTRLGWTAQQVAIYEQATGFNEEEGYSFPVPDCYALYIADGNISDEAHNEFNRLTTELYNKLYAWMGKNPRATDL